MHYVTRSGSKSSKRAHSLKGLGMKTYNQLIDEATQEYLASLDKDNIPTHFELEAQLIAATNAAFLLENTKINKKEHEHKFIKQLTFSQVAQILITLHNVVKIAPSDKNTDPDYDLLAIYEPSGDNTGIYLTSEDQIRSFARLYNHELTINLSKEVFAILRERAPRVNRCSNRDLVPVNNGIFNYQTKELLPFSPEYVFISKSKINYNPNVQSPVFTHTDGTKWDIDSWMFSLTDDAEIVDLLWKIMGAIIRPNVRWNKSAWFFSEEGNNGKGTLVELMRNLCGPGSHTSLPLADMSKDFMLEPLTRINAIIVDENDVGQYIDKAANLKAIITNDVLMINRKHKTPISYQFWGFMVQCLNEFPRIKDRSESFYRRQLFVPFMKCFTGKERRYIKDEYMSNTQVLEYVLKKVLTDIDDYYVLPEPQATKNLLEEYKEANDPVRSFWKEHADEFVWDVLPFQFLFDMYKVWFSRNQPSGSPVGRTTFINNLIAIVNKDSSPWYCVDKSVAFRPGSRMDKPEPLIFKYELHTYANPHCPIKPGGDMDKMCTTIIPTTCRGLQRMAQSSHDNDD